MDYTEYSYQLMEETNLEKTWSPFKAKEDLLQELHRVKSCLARSELLNSDIHIEIEDLKIVNSNLLKQIEENEAQYLRLKLNFNTLRSELENEKECHRITVEEIKEKLTDNQCKRNENEEENSKSEELLMQLSFFSAKNNELQEKLFEAEKLIENFKDNEHHLQERIKSLEKEMRTSSMIIIEKTESLKSIMDALHDLQEEKAVLSSELATIKAGPIGQLNRGNSLFAEVDSKRQSSESKLLSLHNKYNQLKKMLTFKANEIEKLKQENNNLRRVSQDAEKLDLNQYNQFEESYKHRIEDLNNYIKILEKRPESPQIVTISETDLSKLQWINTVVENARAEAREAHKELLQKSAHTLNIADQLYQAQQEIKAFKSNLMKAENQNEELKQKLKQDNEVYAKVLEDDALNNKTKSINLTMQTSIKGVHFAHDVKANDGGNSIKDYKRYTKPFHKIEILSIKKEPLPEVIKE